MPVELRKSPARRARRVVEQPPAQAACCLPQRQAPRQAQRQPGLPLLPELDGRAGLDGSADHGPDGASCRWRQSAGEPQGARGVGRGGPDGAPKAPRAAASLKLWICP